MLEVVEEDVKAAMEIFSSSLYLAGWRCLLMICVLLVL